MRGTHDLSPRLAEFVHQRHQAEAGVERQRRFGLVQHVEAGSVEHLVEDREESFPVAHGGGVGLPSSQPSRYQPECSFGAQEEPFPPGAVPGQHPRPGSGGFQVEHLPNWGLRALVAVLAGWRVRRGRRA